MNKKEIAKEYIKHLENGNIEQIITLFNQNGNQNKMSKLKITYDTVIARKLIGRL